MRRLIDIIKDTLIVAKFIELLFEIRAFFFWICSL